MRDPNKPWLACLSTCGVLLCVSIGYAQQGAPGSVKGDAKIAKERVSWENELNKAPAKARRRKNPLGNDPDAVPAGKKLFGIHCAECHGESAEGTRRAPDLHDSDVQDAAPGAIFWVVTNGIVRHGMPVWSRLPEPQRWQLVTYVKSLGVESHASGSR